MECYCNKCEEWVQGERNEENPNDTRTYCEVCNSLVTTYDTQVAFVTELGFGF